MRFMTLYKPGRESNAPPTQEEMAAMEQFIDELAKSGALIATDGLQSSAKGARVRISDGTFTVTDGPFAETKELIAGYAIINAGSLADAIALTKRFLLVGGEGECEIRQLYEAPAFDSAQNGAAATAS